MAKSLHCTALSTALMQTALAPDVVWSLLLELRRAARVWEARPAGLGFGLTAAWQPTLIPAADAATLIEITETGSWTARGPVPPVSAELLDLYLPMALADRRQPFTLAHLGQSLDGRIATVRGASCSINGPENLTHLHRMRALADAVLVGAGTVECDDPQLTTRRVAGPHPVRVVIDPRRRLNTAHRLFQDRTAPTWLVCAEALADQPGPGYAEVIGIPQEDECLSLQEMVRRLRERGLYGLFVEGGGVTVSAFLQADVLDCLQLGIAPLIIGSGRPGITLPVIEDLSDGLRPHPRRYMMGEDVLFDCRFAR
ncbi:MAG: RibD family protein [Candidatus Competibacteraceae bacterium]|nr:RibD family protein [Candidatus Competibacteraceae bacterium]HRY15238.1 RibD family protein [Candidatus Competibacteraceae bacterium]